MLGSIISGGLDLIGGLVSDSSNRDQGQRNRNLTREMYDKQREDYLEDQKYGLQRQVNAARRAGLSPVSVVGGASAGFQPSVSVAPSPDVGATGRSLGRAGQDLGRAINAQRNSAGKKAEEAGLSVLEAQAANQYAQAQYYASMAARNAQEANQSSGIPGAPRPGIPVDADKWGLPLQDVVKNVPARQISVQSGTHGSVQAGGNPGYMTVKISGGLPVDILRSEEGPQEAFQEIRMNPFAAAEFYETNARRYGAKHAREALQRITGTSAMFDKIGQLWQNIKSAPEKYQRGPDAISQ